MVEEKNRSRGVKLLEKKKKTSYNIKLKYEDLRYDQEKGQI